MHILSEIETKSKDFQMAMERYNRRVVYQKTGLLISVLIVLLQGTSVVDLFNAWFPVNPLVLLVLFIFAYIVTDFISGIVHCYMDNNTNYTSVVGPFVAAFHLHHVRPQYAKRHPMAIYFFESGTKIWLAVYLFILVVSNHYLKISLEVQFCLTCIGVLSSFSEISHYWCHTANAQNKLISFLQNKRIFLSKRHHCVHHVADNKNYAFLNGVCNPLINKIASHVYGGYKNNADLHAKAYSGKQTSNRS